MRQDRREIGINHWGLQSSRVMFERCQDMTRKDEVWQIVCVAERLTHEGKLRFYTKGGLRRECTPAVRSRVFIRHNACPRKRSRVILAAVAVCEKVCTLLQPKR